MNIYLYTSSKSNFREMRLIPSDLAKVLDLKLSDLEGILMTEKKIPAEKLVFSIVDKEKVIEEYAGQFYRF